MTSAKVSVDAVGLFCPMPIVKLKLAVDSVGNGDVVELLADDPAAENDLIAWSKATGNSLIELKKNSDGTISAYIKKEEKK